MKKLVGEWLRFLTWRVRCRCTRLLELFIQQRHTNSELLIIKLLSNGGIPAAYERKNIDPIVLDLLIFSFFFFCIQIPIPQVTKTQLTQRALKQQLRLLSLWMHLIWYVVWLFFCFNYFVLDWNSIGNLRYYLCSIYVCFYYTSLTAKKSQWLISFVNQNNCFLPNTISCWVSCFI